MNARFGKEPALAELVAGLRAGELDFADDPAKARVDFEAALALSPVADDLAFEEVELAGVKILKGSYDGADPDRALLYLHGGAFIAGSAFGYRGLAAELARAGGLTSWSVDYRLAPEHPFPAAVEDCLAVYRVLVAQGIPPARIILAGDSAGGGLVLSTLIALRNAGESLPAAAILLSPFANLACDGSTYATKADVDPSLTVEGLRAGAAKYLGSTDPRHPEASPTFDSLAGLPPLLIQVGSAEILLDDAIRIAEVAGAAGTPVRLDIWPNMPHVFPAFAFMLEAGKLALQDAGQFMRQALAG
ncbi:MAG TPA: alpha/beta hydrolase [Sphingomonadaceae bacterium]|nr:alpha/beta hydrolase [Sphingomonadaceae bacterium]